MVVHQRRARPQRGAAKEERPPAAAVPSAEAAMTPISKLILFCWLHPFVVVPCLVYCSSSGGSKAASKIGGTLWQAICSTECVKQRNKISLVNFLCVFFYFVWVENLRYILYTSASSILHVAFYCFMRLY